jgi:hypothetical protein
MTIHLNGRITDKGELKVDLPPGLPPGEARVTIEVPLEAGWSPAELDQALEIKPMSGAEIVAAGLTGGWKDQGISDGAEWVQEQRRRRRDRRSS